MISILPGCRTSRVPWRRGRTGTAHVDLERIHFAIAEAVDCVRDMGEKLGEPRRVARGYRLACCLRSGFGSWLEGGGSTPRDRWRSGVPDAGSVLVVDDARFAAQCDC